jgi:hypothetical protein
LAIGNSRNRFAAVPGLCFSYDGQMDMAWFQTTNEWEHFGMMDG